jgi:hypothetical protein
LSFIRWGVDAREERLMREGLNRDGLSGDELSGDGLSVEELIGEEPTRTGFNPSSLGQASRWGLRALE